MKVSAPGKLILSGEHSVVHGHPALAMAVSRYVTVQTTPLITPTISFSLADLSYQQSFSLAHLHSLKDRIKQKYNRFVAGDFNIRDVLQKPVELAQIAFSLFIETLNLKLTQGLEIHVASTIPIGCGMGSSAATIISIVHAMALHLDMDLSPEMSMKLGLEAENLQHGFSSGLDLRVSLFGGCLFMQGGETHSRAIPNLPMYLVNTGLPHSSTGECVTTSRHYFLQSDIGHDFAAVTNAMDEALKANDLSATMQAVSANQQLLNAINVVPPRVQQFIAEVETTKAAAKICGAGSVQGDSAGVILVITENSTALDALCKKYQYSLLPITGEARGVHVI